VSVCLLIVQMKSLIILIYSHLFVPRRRFPVIVLLPLLLQDTVGSTHEVLITLIYSSQQENERERERERGRGE
jgi:hypothetical protein